MGQNNVLILMGSPRKKGNCAALAENLTNGAGAVGARVVNLYLHGMDIRPCTACGHCQGHGASGCVMDDDMTEVYQKLREADSIVFASPIYWFSVSAQIKLALDRIYAVGGGSKNVLAGKKFGLLLAYADSDPFTSGAVNALRMFQDISAYLGTTIVGSVYGSAFEAGEIRADSELMNEAYELGEKLGRGD